MKIVRTKYLPLRGFSAMNFLGILFVHPGVYLSQELINHERIHTAQLLEMGIIGFYIWYSVEWVVRLMQRTRDSLDSKQVLTVIENYSKALDLLDAYDHQNMQRPAGEKDVYVLDYEECRRIIDNMRYGNESELFGTGFIREK